MFGKLFENNSRKIFCFGKQIIKLATIFQRTPNEAISNQITLNK